MNPILDVPRGNEHRSLEAEAVSLSHLAARARAQVGIVSWCAPFSGCGQLSRCGQKAHT